MTVTPGSDVINIQKEVTSSIYKTVKKNKQYKPTDSYSYLHYKSNHSRACKDAIPYSQFLRLRRLCSDDNDFDQKCKEMCGFLLSKEYPLSVVSKCLKIKIYF